MGVRAAQDLAVQHAGHVDVSPVLCSPGYLFQPVVANGPRADNFELASGLWIGCRGHTLSFSAVIGLC